MGRTVVYVPSFGVFVSPFRIYSTRPNTCRCRTFFHRVASSRAARPNGAGPMETLFPRSFPSAVIPAVFLHGKGEPNNPGPCSENIRIIWLTYSLTARMNPTKFRHNATHAWIISRSTQIGVESRPRRHRRLHLRELCSLPPVDSALQLRCFIARLAWPRRRPGSFRATVCLSRFSLSVEANCQAARGARKLD